MINKLLANTTIELERFGDHLDISDGAKVYLDQSSVSMQKWQHDYVVSDNDVQIYKNPVKDLLTATTNSVNDVLSLSNQLLLYSEADAEIKILSSACSNTINTISAFTSHTNRISGLETAPAPNSIDLMVPDLNNALSIGQRTLSLVYKLNDVPALKYKDLIYNGYVGQSYDEIMGEHDIPRYAIQDGFVVDNIQSGVITTGYSSNNEFITEKSASNLPMMGSFSSLFINDKIEDASANVAGDYLKLSYTIGSNTSTFIQYIQSSSKLSHDYVYWTEHYLSNPTKFKQYVRSSTGLSNTYIYWTSKLLSGNSQYNSFIANTSNVAANNILTNTFVDLTISLLPSYSFMYEVFANSNNIIRLSQNTSGNIYSGSIVSNSYIYTVDDIGNRNNIRISFAEKDIVNTATNDMKNLANVLNTQMQSDYNFYRNCIRLNKKFDSISRVSNMGGTHAKLFEIIGSDEAKELMNAKTEE